jgi:hypothetical protein
MYESDWVNVYLDDVELPDGTHIDHHVLDFPRRSAGAIVLNERGEILMLWRHRFITGAWGGKSRLGGLRPERIRRRPCSERSKKRQDTRSRMLSL